MTDAKSSIPPIMKWSAVRGRPLWMLIYIVRLLFMTAFVTGLRGIGLLVIVDSPIKPDLGSGIARIFFVLVAGGVALLIRNANLRLYAVIEVFVGLLLAWSLNKPGPDERTRIAILAGAVYVMVRGFDNYQRGHRAAKEKAAKEKADATSLMSPNSK